MNTNKLIQWHDIVKKWEQSNQSQKAFCESQKINYKTFCNWRSKIHKAHNANTNQIPTQAQNFIPLKVKNEISKQDEPVRIFDLAVDSNLNLTSSLQINLRSIFSIWDKINV